jgi:SAM-dependent methyltransferase
MNGAGKPPSQNPALPEFWDKRFRERVTPWDAGGVPQALRDFLARERAKLRVLIPGCGSGYEVRAFTDAGHDVLAIDFSAAALEVARRTLGAAADAVRHGDFFAFDFDAPFDLVYERAFLCALPRAQWPRWRVRLDDVLRPGGRIAGFFYWNDSPRGPPFGLQTGELEALLEPAYERLEDIAVADSIAAFAGRERWQVWQKR